MEYKVGDKVKVRSDLKCEEYYGGITFNFEMNKFKGMEITIARVNYGGYYEVFETPYNFTDEMLEPVEGMSAEELAKIISNICEAHNECSECPILEVKGEDYCMIGIGKNADKTLKIAKQWKADHEKKPIETEYVWYLKIIEADTHLLKHEELLKTDFSIPMDKKKEEILKKYCSEHDGKYYAISERRCVIKE